MVNCKTYFSKHYSESTEMALVCTSVHNNTTMKYYCSKAAVCNKDHLILFGSGISPSEYDLVFLTIGGGKRFHFLTLLNYNGKFK